MTPGEHDMQRVGWVSRQEHDDLEREVWRHETRLSLIEERQKNQGAAIDALTRKDHRQESPLPGWLPWAILIGLSAFYAAGALLSTGRIP